MIYFNGASWSMFFDGSDVGVTGELDAFHILDADSILLSLAGSATLPGSVSVQDRDIVRFDATSLGNVTAGAFSIYFDGDDVGLSQSGEDIDAFTVLPDGRLVMSFLGNWAVPGLSGPDEDLVVFTPTALGPVTSGAWALYFDGSDVALSSGEDVDAVDVASNGAIYLSTDGVFVTTVNGISGEDEDVFSCMPVSLGSSTVCNYSSTLTFDGSTWGLAADDVDALDLP